MKFATLVASFAFAIFPALLVSAQQEPSRLQSVNYDRTLAGGYHSHSQYNHSPIANCQCENRKGYDLWCKPVSFLDHFRRSNSNCCGKQPAPSCCAPEPTCAPPAPTYCAPEPTCAAPAPTCCAPEPTCAAPAPTCCAPEPSCAAPSACGCNTGCKRTGLFDHNPLSDLHAKLKSMFSCKKCRKSTCCCDGCSSGAAPMYYEPSMPHTLPMLPDAVDNPFEDDPTTIPAPNTTTRTNSRSLVKPVYYGQ
jgi:hypothetical protein